MANPVLPETGFAFYFFCGRCREGIDQAQHEARPEIGRGVRHGGGSGMKSAMCDGQPAFDFAKINEQTRQGPLRCRSTNTFATNAKPASRKSSSTNSRKFRAPSARARKPLSSFRFLALLVPTVPALLPLFRVEGAEAAAAAVAAAIRLRLRPKPPKRCGRGERHDVHYQRGTI